MFVCVCVQRSYKKAAAFVLRAVAKHSPELSQAVVACRGIDALVLCLEEFDPRVKEAAAWALGCIAQHNTRKEDADAALVISCCNFIPFLLVWRTISVRSKVFFLPPPLPECRALLQVEHFM